MIQFNHEYSRRLRAAAIGCGGHAMRNVLPCFQYAPVDLVAVCDLDPGRASACARQFGGRSAYTSYNEMLEKEQPEIVFVVTNYDDNGHPRYPAIVADVLRAGAHAWIEKPPAATAEQVRQMMKISGESGRYVGVGFKKMFFPANQKAKKIIQQPEFGAISTITARYPQTLPAIDKRRDDRAMIGFLDHMVHPYSLLRYLGGDIESLYVERHDSGASITSLRFASGAVGSLHLPLHAGATPLERTEVVGAGASVVVENNIRVTYYRSAPGPEGGYGRAPSFFSDNEHAPLTWEPEFSLGQLYNKGLFLLGYAPEILYFCQCVLDETQPEKGNLQDALELLQIYEAYRQPDGQRVLVNRNTA